MKLSMKVLFEVSSLAVQTVLPSYTDWLSYKVGWFFESRVWGIQNGSHVTWIRLWWPILIKMLQNNKIFKVTPRSLQNLLEHENVQRIPFGFWERQITSKSIFSVHGYLVTTINSDPLYSKVDSEPATESDWTMIAQNRFSIGQF